LQIVERNRPNCRKPLPGIEKPLVKKTTTRPASTKAFFVEGLLVSEVKCPHCNAVLPQEEITAGWCENCGKRIPAYVVSASRGESPGRPQGESTGDRTDDATDKHTARCDALLPPVYRGKFRVLAQVMEKASVLWAVLLTPVFWGFKNKHYVLTYDAPSRSLRLFRLSLGLFGVGEAYAEQKYPLDELQDLDFRGGLLTASLSFRKKDGTMMNLFVPKPAKQNAQAIVDSLPPRKEAPRG
jgi:hypothetical protein